MPTRRESSQRARTLAERIRTLCGRMYAYPVGTSERRPVAQIFSLGSIIASGIACGLLQQVWFNPNVLGLRIAYPWRIAGFGITFYAILAPCAWFGGWVPHLAGPWVTFTVLYLVVLAVMTTAFTRAFRRQRAAYDERLAAYHRRRQNADMGGDADGGAR